MTTVALFLISPMLVGCALIAVAVHEGTAREDWLTRAIFGSLAAVSALASVFCLVVSLWRAVQ